MLPRVWQAAHRPVQPLAFGVPTVSGETGRAHPHPAPVIVQLIATLPNSYSGARTTRCRHTERRLLSRTTPSPASGLGSGPVTEHAHHV